ncbi:F-box protein At3g28330 [Capsella rubella]|uniref:F-box protein At3g28330 n=1 Tax=Capsella rubella TaxID=81985 RepID=UPI000CD5BF9C|nr:F-box protein At3g28330 [Capsella rubella]
MNSLNLDLLEIILARLPIRTSQFATCDAKNKEILAHYGCDNWGLSLSLYSYISSFLTDEFENHKDPTVYVLAYTDVGLILVCSYSDTIGRTNYVANPISRQCVGIPTPPPQTLLRVSRPVPSGLVTRVEDGVVLGYKVVLISARNIIDVITLLIYSSETGLWSLTTLRSSLLLRRIVWHNPVNLNGSLYWLGYEQSKPKIQVVVSHDFYAKSDLCQVLHFPDDLNNKSDCTRLPCTTSQGFLMYMNISLERRLSIWRLESCEWKLVAQITSKTAFDYIPLAINPFDSNIVYLLRNMHHCLACANLDKGKFEDHISDSGTLTFSGDWDTAVKDHYEAYHTFSLPRWLYRIPSSLS